MLWMKYIIRMFSLPDGLVEDYCADVCLVAKSRMRFPQYKHFVGRDTDSECVI